MGMVVAVVALAVAVVAVVKEANTVMILISLYNNALTGSNHNLTSRLERNRTKLDHIASPRG